MDDEKSSVEIIREVKKEDFDFVTELMYAALNPYYGGDHQLLLSVAMSYMLGTYTPSAYGLHA